MTIVSGVWWTGSASLTTTMARPAAGKRKREADLDTEARQTTAYGQTVEEGILRQYYETVQTLRQYVLAKLPAASRLRRKKIVSIAPKEPPYNAGPRQQEVDLAHLLDSVLVAVREDRTQTEDGFQKWMQLSQNGDDSYVTLDGTQRVAYSQSEVRGLRRRSQWLDKSNIIVDRRLCHMASLF